MISRCCEPPAPQREIEALILGTCECDLIWRFCDTSYMESSCWGRPALLGILFKWGPFQKALPSYVPKCSLSSRENSTFFAPPDPGRVGHCLLKHSLPLVLTSRPPGFALRLSWGESSTMSGETPGVLIAFFQQFFHHLHSNSITGWTCSRSSK